MPMPIGTLDAIHLATALICRQRIGPLRELVTHDETLATAERAFGFDDRGC
jgi:predicted nucleic acid-binding protein